MAALKGAGSRIRRIARRRLAAAAGPVILVLCAGVAAASDGPCTSVNPEVYLGSETSCMTPEQWQSPPLHRYPVLFVHGHNADSPTDEDFNYRKNFLQSPAGLTSFQDALGANAALDIEPYYIRFVDQGQSIVENARQIGLAVEKILHRHDPDYVSGSRTPPVRVRLALVAMSKGTVSSRLYLKSLRVQQYDLPAPVDGFNPISEFVALAPANHGLALPQLGSSLAQRQLNNGYTANRCGTCVDSNGLPVLFGSQQCDPQALDFIERLNGHDIEDSKDIDSDGDGLTDDHPSEAPLSRPDGTSPESGTLYLSLYAENNQDDVVGGHTPSGDCQGRELAQNLAAESEDREIAVHGASGIDKHRNTSHMPEAICLSLYAIAHHDAAPESFECASTQIPHRPTAEAVLDLSGSMLAPACPGCRPKLEILKEAFEVFLQTWRLLEPEGRGDRVGVVPFQTQVTPVNVAGGGQPPVYLTPVADAYDDLVPIVRGLGTVATNLTAMGGGLQRAIERLRSDGGPPRSIILFTDGMQNVNPMLLEDPAGGAYCIVDEPGRGGSGVLPSAPPVCLGDDLGIKIYSIGVGVGPWWLETLQEISEPGGFREVSEMDSPTLQAAFDDLLQAMLQGNSPQIIGQRWGVLGENGATETFTIDRTARRLLLRLSWRPGPELGFRVFKGGVDVTASGTLLPEPVTDNPFYRIFAIDLPPGGAGAGGWTLDISGPQGVPYLATAIADEAALDFVASFGKRRYRVGERLLLEARLAIGGKPLVEGCEVTARVRRPKVGAGTLLATTAAPPRPRPGSQEADPGPPPGAEPGSTAGQVKLAALLRQPGFWQRFRARQETALTLIAGEDGSYTGEFADTRIPGPYTVVFSADCADTGIGPIARTLSRTTLVEVGAAEPAASSVTLRQIDATAESRILELTLRPRDRFGNYLGVDRSRRIRVKVAGEELPAAELEDLLDGSYRSRIVIGRRADPELEITVLDRPLYRRGISELESRGLSVSAHLGTGFPVGGFDTLADAKSLVELGLEARLTPRWSLNTVLGRYRFDPDFDLNGATLYFRRFWDSGRGRLFAEAGPGLYDPDGLDAALGLSAGVGASRPLRPGLVGEIGTTWVRVLNDGTDVQFVAVKAGVRYRLP